VETNTHTPPSAKQGPNRSEVWSGGLIAIGLIILQDFLSLNQPDRAVYISIFAFAIAIPILACNLLVNFSRRGSIERASVPEILFYLLGIFTALIGIAAAFWHTCWIAALVFSASSLCASVVYYKASYRR
jgi:hypothetical protein